MNRYNHLKEKAIVLRQKGASLNFIIERLKLPKTTVYYWIKDIKLKRIASNIKKANNVNKIKFEKIRKDNYDDVIASSDDLLKDLDLRDFVILYMAEGYRRNRNQVAICNSSIDIMKLANKIIKKLANNKISYVIRIHKDQDETLVKKFWADGLDINFIDIKVIYKKNSSNLRQRNWRCENGVLTILSSDTKLRTKIQALMDKIKSEWKY